MVEDNDRYCVRGTDFINCGGTALNSLPDESKTKKLRHTIIFVCLLAVFILSRYVCLDRDLPPAGISSYVPVDELYYTIPAFNQYHYGEIVQTSVPAIKENPQPTNVMENAATFLSLSMFGNNYYGLRMASVFASLITLICLYLVFKKLLFGNDQVNPGVSKPMPMEFILFMGLIYLVTDFSFLMAGRVAEPTIFRMLSMVVIIWLATFLSGLLDNKLHALLLGFLGAAAVLFVYIYNVFVYCALALSVFIWAYKKSRENAFIQTASFVLGSIAAVFVYQYFAISVYDSSLLEIYQHLVPFGNRLSADIGGVDRLVSHLANLSLVFLTNIFRFNPALLFMFLLSIPVFFWRVRSARDNTEILILNLIGFLILQSIVINDYPMRKLVILLPLVIAVIVVAARHFPNYRASLQDNDRGWNNYVFFAGLSFAAALGIAVVYVMNYLSDHLVSAGGVAWFNLAVLFVVGLAVFTFLLGKRKIPDVLAVGMILVFLVPNIYMDFRYVYGNRTYYFRDAMIAMGERIDGKVTVGGCSYGFRLYNTSIPVLDSYIYKYGVNLEAKDQFEKDFDRSFVQGIGSYSVAYTGETPGLAVGIDYMTKHNMHLVQRYELPDYMNTDIGIYAYKPEP